MKKTVSSRNTKTRHRNQQNLEVTAETVKVLRTVGDNEAFYFYEALGKPTGEVARNLPDFLDKVKSIKTESIIFHLQRKDFENWIGKVLGDTRLAQKLEEISPSNNSDIRMSITRTVGNRIKELTESSTTILADANSTVLVSSQ